MKERAQVKQRYFILVLLVQVKYSAFNKTDCIKAASQISFMIT